MRLQKSSLWQNDPRTHNHKNQSLVVTLVKTDNTNRTVVSYSKIVLQFLNIQSLAVFLPSKSLPPYNYST